MGEMRLPQRSGTVEPAAARALDAASLVASRDETRPVLTYVLWEGLEKSTRIVATDTYRLLVIRVARTRAGIKPGPGIRWGIHAGAWRGVRSTRKQRAGEVSLARDGQECGVFPVPCTGKSARATMASGVLGTIWTMEQGPLTFPSWPKVMPGGKNGPEGDPAWELEVPLGELVAGLGAMRRAYTRGKQPIRTIWLPEDGALAILPTVELRERQDWPAEWVGCHLEASRQHVRVDQPIALDVNLLHDVLGRLAEWVGEEAAVRLRVWERLKCVELSVAGEAERIETRLVVMPMQLLIGGQYRPLLDFEER